MPYRPYNEQNCSIAAALEVVGERWSLLVMRDVLLGRRRFAEIKRSLGVAPNILSDRLATLVEHGLLERRPSASAPTRVRADAQGPRPQPDPDGPAAAGATTYDAPARAAARGRAQGLRPRRPPAAALQPLRRGDRARSAGVAAGPGRNAEAAGGGHPPESLTAQRNVTTASAATQVTRTAVAHYAIARTAGLLACSPISSRSPESR